MEYTPKNDTPPQNSPKGYLGHNHAKHAYFFGLATGTAFLATIALIVLTMVWNTNSAQTHEGENIPKDVINTQEEGGPAPYEKVESITKDSIRYIKGSGKLTFIEYSDLECPFCKKFHPIVNDIAKEYEGKIAFTFKHFPLNIHPKAKREAVAAECAGNQQKFFEYIDRIYEITPGNNGLEDDKLFEVAQELQLNIDTFRTCVENEETLATVAADALEAQGTGGTGTPHSILIDENGKILTTFKGSLSKEQLKAAFDQFLNQ